MVSSHEDFSKLEHLPVPAHQLALVPGNQCTTVGINEQKLPCWAVACVWSSATIHRNRMLDEWVKIT